jgi:hypothetical protein
VWHVPTAQLRLFPDVNVFVLQCKHARVALASLPVGSKSWSVTVSACSLVANSSDILVPSRGRGPMQVFPFTFIH